MKDKLRIVTIADLHCGAFDAKQWEYEIVKGFIEPLEKLEFDALLLAGDYFDKKISANSEYAKVGMRTMFKLRSICEDKGAKLRIIKGTESHDNSQLNMFEGLVGTTDCDFGVFQTLSDEQLFPNFRILYVAEEYINDESYYTEYMDEEKKYDMILGHGLVDIATFIAKVQESEETHPSAPIFKVDDLMKYSTGPVYFGHIHKQMHKDRFRYIGSFSTWAYGETHHKGFMITEYDTINRLIISEEYVMNEYVRHYDTWRFKENDSLFTKSANEIAEKLLKDTTSYEIGFLRLFLTIPENYGEANYLTNLLNEVFAHHDFIKLKIDNNSKIIRREQIKNEVSELLNEYQILFKKSVEEEEKLQVYIQIKYGKNISLKKIKKYLHEPFKGVL